jgi:DNA-binding transcriptional regulator LsrR (DeoR family)
MFQELDTPSKIGLATTAAELYYMQDWKMEAIGSKLNLSRSSVSRLLQMARDRGIVEFHINRADDQLRKTEEKIKAAFKINVRVIPVAENATGGERLDAVGTETARQLGNFFRPGISIGLAWGSTISSVSRRMYQYPVGNSTVVQLNGAGNDHSTGLSYSGEILNQFGKNLGANVVHFPVPAFFDDPAAKEAMWRERSTKRILDIQQRIDLAIFGLGRIDSEVPSQVYAAGYLERPDLDELKEENIVGDIATVFFREDGSWEDIALNKRASGPSLDQLRRTPKRVCVVSGPSKLLALQGALAGDFITDLFIDDITAEKLLETAS